jgi:hypothetical protein
MVNSFRDTQALPNGVRHARRVCDVACMDWLATVFFARWLLSGFSRAKSVGGGAPRSGSQVW